MRITLTKIISAFLLIILPGIITAQNIQFLVPDKLEVCNSDELRIIISNEDTINWEDLNLQLELPCGLRYVQGSLSRGSETNTSHPSFPSFDLDSLESGANITLQIDIAASCEALDCINNSELFYVNGILKFNNDSLVSRSPNFGVITALPVITDIDKLVMEGAKGSILERKITIRNTRQGSLDTLVLTDQFGSGLSISADMGTDISSSPGVFRLALYHGDFMAIGNGDGRFDFDEEICIIQTIHIDACGFRENFVRSAIDVEWGCYEEKCASPFGPQLALVDLDYNIVEGPVLDFVTEVNHPDCYCENAFIPQSLTITNSSAVHDASELLIKVNSENFPGSVIPGGPVKLINSGDTTLIDVDFSVSDIIQCDSGNSYFNQFLVNIPLIPAGETLILEWDVLFCAGETCNAAAYQWSYEYSYLKDCTLPEDDFYQDFAVANSEVSQALSAFFGLTPAFIYGDERELLFQLNSENFTTQPGTLDIELYVDCHLEVLEEDWLLEGVAPVSIYTEIRNDLTFIELSYPLPLDFNSGTIPIDVKFLCGENCPEEICDTEYVTTCESPCVAETFIFAINYNATLNFDHCSEDCLIEFCSFNIFSFDCDLPICEEIIPGYFLGEFELKRLNRGLPDNDNDHFPDTGGDLNPDLIRLDRAVTGDTLRAVIRGEVIADIAGTPFDSGRIAIGTRLIDSEGYDASQRFVEYARLTTRGYGLVNVFTRFEIWDASSDEVYVCDELPVFGADSSGFVTFDISLDALREMACPVPIDYYYENGDSIILTADYKVDYNTLSQELNFGVMEIEFQNGNLIYSSLEPEYSSLACACGSERVEIANYKTVITDGKGIMSHCYGDSEYIRKSFKFGTISDFFPYEYKPPVELVNFTLPRIEGITLTDAEIFFLISNGRPLDVIPTDSTTFLDLAFSQMDDLVSYPLAENITGFYEFRFEELFENYSWDENIEFRAGFRYKNNECLFKGSSEYFGKQINAYSDAIKSSKIFEDEEHRVDLRGSVPLIDMEIQLCDVSSFTDTVNWDIELNFNILNDTPANEDVNIWLEAYSPNNKILDFSLLDIANGDTLNSTNGIFNLLNSKTDFFKEYKLIALTTGCDTQDLVIKYGWDCSPLSGPTNHSCFQDSLQCSAYSPPGVLEIIADPDPIKAPVCDTFPYSSIRVLNAGLGPLTISDITLKLFRGIAIVKNSAMIEYPTGSSEFYSIPDPENLSQARKRWFFDEDYPDFLNTFLPGVNSGNLNSFTLYFKTVSDCEFLSGSRIIYYVSGAVFCNGINSVELVDLSGRMEIIDSTVNYEAELEVNIERGPRCSDTVDVFVHLKTEQAMREGDRIYMNASTLVDYSYGSCTGDLINCEPDFQNDQFIWELPKDSTDVFFTFKLDGNNALPCDTAFLIAYSTSSANLNCETADSSCQVDFVTAEVMAPFNSNRTSIDLSVQSIERISDSFYSINILAENLGPNTLQELTLFHYLRDPEVNIIPLGDSLIGSTQCLTGIAPFESKIISDIFNVGFYDICHLLTNLDSGVDCLCVGDDLETREYNEVSLLDTTICSGEQINIGIPGKEGFNYSWQDTANIVSCDTCATTDFQVSNKSEETIDYTLRQEIRGPNNCRITAVYNISVKPEPGIIQIDYNICKGDTIEIIAEAAVVYEWTGENIINNNLRLIEAVPTADQYYYVEIIDENGCSYLDSVWVNVLDSPPADAGPDLELCFGEQAVLNVRNPSDSFSYRWRPGVPFLESPHEPSTVVNFNQTQTYILEVTDGICRSADTVNVIFADRFDIEPIDDILICRDKEVNLMLDPQYEYVWSPSFINMCRNNNCSEVVFTPANPVSMQVIAIDDLGCRDTIRFNIDLTDEIIRDTLNREICPEDSIFWSGRFISAPGVYCDSLESFEGCDTLQCLIVDVLNVDHPDIFASEQIVDAGVPVQLEVAGDFEFYEWDGDGNFSCLNCPDPEVIPDSSQWITVETTDRRGCVTRDSIFIEVRNICSLDEILIPNAFTPNSNNKNDRFRLANVNKTGIQIHMRIFDRWGELLYESFEHSGWDGRYESVDLPEGVYLYIIDVSCGQGNEKIFKGDLTLIR